MPTVSDYTALLSGDYWNGIEVTGKPVIVTYSFPTSAPAYDINVQGFTAATVASFQAFNAAEQTQARQALGEWAQASGIIFVEVAPGKGDINFQLVDLSTSSYGSPGGIGFYPFGNWDYFTYPNFSSDLDLSGDVFMNSQYAGAGLVDYGTLLHEIGHALGLKHPTEVVYSPVATHDQVLDTGDDPTRTIMATVGNPANLDPHLLQLDKDAAAFLYGASGGQVVTASTSGTNAVSSWNWNTATQTLTQAAVAGGETIRGSSVTDVITALSGSNRLYGLNGNDTLVGGTGDDVLDGGPGVDSMTGSDGNDTYSVDDSTDQVFEAETGGSYDVVNATSSYILPAFVEALQVFGSGLVATGNALGNTIYGDGTYSSTLNGLAGDDYMVAGIGNDTLNGGTSNDLVYGQSGSDTLDGGDGNDLLDGGVGTDTATYGSAGAPVIVSLSLAGPQATGGAGTDTLVSIENLVGSAFADTLTGDANANVIDGGAGADSMSGGGGNDTYSVDNAGDKVVESIGQGNDTIKSSVSYGLGGIFIETLQLTGTAAINATGNTQVNTLIGNSAANILDGMQGIDTMSGGLGDDTYVVDNAGDKVVESIGQGNDTIKSSVSYGLGGIFIETLQLTGTAAVNATGNTQVNTLIGNSSANVLDGMQGIDTLTGGAGADTFRFSVAPGAANADTITDFIAGTDRIALSASVHAGLVAGALAPAAFHLGTVAAAPGDLVIYDGATGRLWFDADGAGGATQSLIATLTPGAALTAGDILVI